MISRKVILSSITSLSYVLDFQVHYHMIYDTVLAALLWQDRPRGIRYQHRYTAATFHPRSIVI